MGFAPARMMTSTECAHFPRSLKLSRRQSEEQIGRGDVMETGSYPKAPRGIQQRGTRLGDRTFTVRRQNILRQEFAALCIHK
jgi:hypothetical protein